MSLRDSLSMYWPTIQGNLFPWLEEELGPLTEKQQQLVTVLEIVRLEAFLRHWPGMVGRPPSDRAALARSRSLSIKMSLFPLRNWSVLLLPNLR